MPLKIARPHSRGQVTYLSRQFEMLRAQGRKGSRGCGEQNGVDEISDFCDRIVDDSLIRT